MSLFALLRWATAICSSLWVISSALASGAAPSRPLNVTRLYNVDYVDTVDLAKQLGLDRMWIEKGKKIELFTSGSKLQFEADAHEFRYNSVRIFTGDAVVYRRGSIYISKIDADALVVPLVKPSSAGLIAIPRIIALDAGHGGIDPGKENHALGLKEKVLTFDVVERLRKILLDRGYKVVLTRTDDTKIELADRPEIANRAGADLFVSMHFNSAGTATNVSGTEVYTFPPATQRSSDALGSKNNDSDKDPSPVNRYNHWNILMANFAQRRLLSELKTFDRGIKHMHLGVLRGLNCPGILVESAYLSNPADARKVGTPVFRQQIAQSIADAISDYAKSVAALHPPPPISAPAPSQTAASRANR